MGGRPILRGKRESPTSDALFSPYYQYERPEVLALVPLGARSILDVGCAAGRLGHALKLRNPACRVIGVEAEAGPAADAASLLDQVILGDVETTELPLADGSFDCLIYADVLEHLKDPIAVLRSHLPLLKPNGVVVGSIPNVRHHSVITQLLQGRWDYTDQGLLDRAHLRFFTRATMVEMLSTAGLVVNDLRITAFGEPPEGWNALVETVNRVGLRGATLAQESRAYQFLTVSSRKVDRLRELEGHENGMLSIVIPTWNQLDSTQKCVAALREHVRMPMEIIAVDNGSTDGTAEFWRDQVRTSLGGRAHVEAICNVENRGFPVARNQGLGAARGDYVVFLDHYTVVQPGTLERLAAWVRFDQHIGLVGPRANSWSGHQLIPAAPGGDALAVAAFAKRWIRQHDGGGFPCRRLLDVCLLGRKEIFEKVGGFDPRFTHGNFEDDDLSVRVMRAGYLLWTADDAFVDHNGQPPIPNLALGDGDLRERNRCLYYEKWGGSADEPIQQVTGRAATGAFDPAHDFVAPWQDAPLSMFAAGETPP